MKRKLTVILTLTALLLMSCDSLTDTSPLSGTSWYWDITATYRWELVFNTDGTGEDNGYDNGVLSSTSSFTWSTSDNLLTFDYDGFDPYDATFEIRGNQLEIVSVSGLEDDGTFTKK